MTTPAISPTSSFITFQSKSSADILMHRQYAERILSLLHKTLESGIITAAESKEAIVTLELALDPAPSKSDMSQSNNLPTNSPINEKKIEPPEVAFRTRVFPFLEMLRRAHHKQYDIVWWQ